MCGRFTQRQPASRIAQEFQVDEVPPIEARYNIAPTQTVLSIHQAADGREAKLLKWGLIPSWTKDPSIGAKLINARSETVAEKPSFREAFKKRRCLIPADGFYEWQRTGGRKQPYFFRMLDDRPFGFAGLWERWKGQDGEVVESCAILTTEANELLQPVHDRMPVILRAEDYELWLDEDVRQQDFRRELLRPFPASEMTAYPVSTLVNSTRNHGMELIEEMKINSA
jgi:putative SOS response-associated peptidase YedK